MALKNSDHDYRILAGYLKGLAFRLRLFAALEVFFLLASGFLLILLGNLFAFVLQDKFSYLPFFYNLIALGFWGLLVFMGLRRVFSRPSAALLAGRLEKKFPRLRDDLTNSLLLFREAKEGPTGGRMSKALVTAQLKRTAEEIGSLKTQEVITGRGTFRHLLLLIPLLIAFSLVFSSDHRFLSRSLALILNPFSSLPVRETEISLEPAGGLVLRGDGLTVKAQVKGEPLDKLSLALWPEGREGMRLSMDGQGEGRFVYRIAQVQSSFRYQAFNGHAASPVYALRVVDPPEVGKVKLTLIPPDYTRLSREIREEGHIEALTGTQVLLEARATKRVKEAKLILNQENQLLLEVQGDRLTGSLMIFSPGSYAIKVKDELGFENPKPVVYQIRLLPDKVPEAEILSPAQDLEISGGEILPILYRAQDDFGLTAVKLSYYQGGQEKAVSLKNPAGERSLGPETYKWDVSSLILIPGEKVVYRLGAWDNDSVSGPKAGYSRSFTLSVRDERTLAADEGEAARKVADALLNLLADQLEAKADREALGKRMEEILNQVERNVERPGNRTEPFDLEALKRNLSSLKERFSQESQETVTQEMERLALLAEDMAKRAKMNEVETLARELRNRQRRLLETLNELKGPVTPEVLESVRKELQKLEELLRSVMQAMTQMAGQLPDDFLNSPDLTHLDFQDLFKDLEEMYKKLAAGDLSGALEAAQRLLQALSDMMAALGRAGSSSQASPFDKLQGEFTRQAGELDKILTEQRAILSETEGIGREWGRRLEEETAKRAKDSLPALQESLGKLKRSLWSEQTEVIAELERLWKEGKPGEFSALAKALEKEFEEGSENRRLIGELRKKAESLTPDSREVPTADEKEKLAGLSRRQGEVRDRTAGLKEKLDMLAQLFPGLDTEIVKDLKEAAASMSSAASRLKREDAPGAIPPEQEAIKSLSKSQQGMQQAAQQMNMRTQMARRGYPWGYDPRPGWYYGPWAPLPTLPQPELRRPTEKGFTGFEKEEFDPPAKEAYKAPGALREKVMEALKEKVPPQYKREVEKYFKGLTE